MLWKFPGKDILMVYKPTYEELAQKVRQLEKETVEHKKVEIAQRK